MHAHNDTPDNPGDDRDAVVIPFTRKAGDSREKLPETGSGQPVWRYDQERKRGNDRTYSGHVNHVHGAEVERLRGEPADVTFWTGPPSNTLMITPLRMVKSHDPRPHTR
jgi:hypothetical protein